MRVLMSTSFTRRPLSPTNQSSDSFERVSSAELAELSPTVPTVPGASDMALSVVLAAVSARASVSFASFSLFTRMTTASSILNVAFKSRVACLYASLLHDHSASRKWISPEVNQALWLKMHLAMCSQRSVGSTTD